MRLPKPTIVYRKGSKAVVLQWLSALYFFVNIFMRTGHAAIVYLAVFVAVGAVGLVVFIAKRQFPKKAILVFMMIYIFFGLLNWFLIKNVSIVDLGNDVLLFGVLILMIEYPMDRKSSAVFFYLSLIPFLAAYFTGAKPYLLLTSSSNYISVLLILSASIYYIGLHYSEQKFRLLHIIPAFLCALLSVWARGRGGILSCVVMLVLLFGYFLIGNVRSGASKKTVFWTGLVLIAALSLLIGRVNLIDVFMSFGKWSSRGGDSGDRLLIWGSYLRKAEESPLYFLLGAPLKQIPIIHAFEDNTHNSFIQLHANNGLLVFLLFFFLLARTFLYQINKKQALLFIVLFTICLRGMTDKFIFGQYGMPIVLFLVLEPYFDKYIRMNLQNRFRSDIHQESSHSQKEQGI